MVNLTIDNVKIEVAEGTTIMQAKKEQRNRNTTSMLFKRFK